MFIFHKDTTLEDLGNGVTRRILAHDGKMMAVEVNFAAGAGDTLYKRPGIMHGCVCLQPGTLLDTFTPIREDFLEG